MVYEDVGDAIEVISLFREGKIHPLRFKWKDRVYKVSQINGDWMSDVGDTRLYHFSVLVGGPDCFEICFDSRMMQWQLARVCLDG